MRDQFKHRKRKKNGLTNKIKLRDVQDKIFEVKKTVPDLEMEFYKDQCSDRLLFIGPLDKKITNENKNNLTEQEATESKKKKREAELVKRSQREELRKQQEVSDSVEGANNEVVENDEEEKFSGYDAQLALKYKILNLETNKKNKEVISLTILLYILGLWCLLLIYGNQVISYSKENISF